MNNLRAIMEQEAGSKGTMTFARFMELALYCPNFGYYERPETTVGRSGDFFTSVSVGSLFAELLGFQFAEWLGSSPRSPVQIVEAGAHDGRLAADILGWLRTRRLALAESVEYWIVEPSAARIQAQKETLGELASLVRWFPSWSSVPASGVNGIIFSNELLDAMPVHRLGWNALKMEWFEWGVALHPGNESLSWTKMPADPATLRRSGLADLPSELLSVLPDGFSTEVGVAAIDWWTQAAAALHFGKLLTIDYGLTAEEFFLPERSQGTLRAYCRHQISSDILARPGEQDLTAHVNFTDIQNAGEARGLHTDCFESQAQFLTAILQQIDRNPSSFAKWTSKHARQFQTLTHPLHLGRPFRVLVQSRPYTRQHP